ncbi:MAG: hypothetical protein ABEH61_05220 [Haloarculaceae archaeon]
MSLKCSVFGHRFSDTDVSREREEQGSEVVITITETETCERCGETRVVSENKEVTTLETPSDIVGEGIDDGDPEPSDDAGSPVPERIDTGTEGAEVIEEAEGTASDAGDGRPDHPEQTGTGTASATTTGTETGTGAGASARDDDGVILEEGSDEPDRAPGEWPQDTDETDGEEWTPETEPGELRPVEDEQPDVERIGEAVTVPEGEFRCPECGFTTAVESSSLREGDFCPQCHKGSLTQGSGE